MPQSLLKDWVIPLYKDVRQFTLDTLFPITCVICEEREGKFICLYCKSQFTQARQQCIVCKKDSLLGLTHPGCKTPQGADGLISVLDYRDEKVAKTIVQGKYHFLKGVFAELGNMVANKLISPDYKNILRDFILVPIPLAKPRARWRGFNQAEVICESISKQLGVPILNVLMRKKNTKIQKDLKREARLKNVANAFAVSPPFQGGVPREAGWGGWSNYSNVFRGKSFILVDDVTTTGSTLLEAVKILKQNGASEVWCLTVARD